MSGAGVAVGQGLRLGLIYFTIVFVAGAILAIPRVLIVAPSLGEMAGVALELPIILTLAWLVSQRLTDHLRDGVVERSVMGASALLLLLLAEFAIALVRTGGQPGAALALWSNLPAAVGLMGQLLFAFLPLIGETRSHPG